MAGSYPDVPGARIAYDRDGSTGARISNTNAVTSLTAGEVNNMNDEDADSTTMGDTGRLAIFFPVPMTLVGCFHAGSSTITTEISSNTTNGVDGTWTTFRAGVANAGISPTYRSSIFTAGAPSTGVKSIRFTTSSSSAGAAMNAAHVYGYPDSNSDRLEFWHPTLDQPLRNTPAYFDYGDVSRSAANIERDFRIKNLSTSLTANTITVGREAPTDTSPTYVSQTEFRYNGGSYGSTASLGSLAPNTISNVFTAKFDISATAVLSVWAQRYFADAVSWS